MMSDFAGKISTSTGKIDGRWREDENKKATAINRLQWLWRKVLFGWNYFTG
jgi:hypothetical protein